MKKLILIDGNALVHRAFHALPPLTSPKGIVTNAVFGFSSILIKIIRELKPDYMAASYDLAGPTFRHDAFAEYKEHRVRAPQELYDQIPMTKDILRAFGVPVYEKQGYEADDLIGTLAIKAKTQKDLQIIIATGDLDTLQLVDDDKVVVFTLRKGMSDTVVYDEKAVAARYGLKPGQLNDFKGLKGDPSDNIPGVSGIGEKTAAQLIQDFSSLEILYEYLEKTAGEAGKTAKKKEKKPKISEKLAEKLLTNKDQAFFSKQLSTIVTDLDVDFSLEKAEWRENMDLKQIEAAFKDLGFFSLVKRLAEIGIDLNPQSAMSFEAARNDQDLDIDPDKNNFYITGETNKAIFDKIAANPKFNLIGHDLKLFFKEAIRGGQYLKNKIFDTKIAAYLLNPDLKDYDLEKVYYSEFGESPGMTDKAACLYRLKQRLQDKLESNRLMDVAERLDMPLVPVLAEMELNGVRVDTSAIKQLKFSGDKELSKLEADIYKLAGGNFNINSPQQLAEILYGKLAIKGKIRKTGGGALSTAAPELEKLRDEHPIIELILQYRELQKLKTTYIEPFPLLVDRRDGRIHTTYNQTGAGTGRLSSENPNLQNIPIKTELGREFRKVFVAEDGYKLVSFDYSQIDLRVAAHVAKDEKMIEVFRRGEDIHTATAADVFGVEPQDVTREMRRQAKTLNFGVLYGMGPLGFSRAAGVSMQRAKEFIGKYFTDFAGVAKYMEETKAKAHHDGYVETIFGRRRQILDIYSTIPQMQAQAERIAINHPIQGTAADLMKLAMIGVWEYLHGNTPRNDARLLLQVHDELVFEIKDDLVGKLIPVLKKIMESVHELAVPLVVDVKFGNNWEDQHA